jgi:hypothetical protein
MLLNFPSPPSSRAAAPGAARRRARAAGGGPAGKGGPPPHPAGPVTAMISRPLGVGGRRRDCGRIAAARRTGPGRRRRAEGGLRCRVKGNTFLSIALLGLRIALLGLSVSPPSFVFRKPCSGGLSARLVPRPSVALAAVWALLPSTATSLAGFHCNKPCCVPLQQVAFHSAVILSVHCITLLALCKHTGFAIHSLNILLILFLIMISLFCIVILT